MSPLHKAFINAAANTGTVVSEVIDAQFLTSGSIQAAFSDAAAAGTLLLQCSNDPNPPANWDTVKNGSLSASATVASGALTTISMQWLNFRWLRISWTRSGGAGTFSVNGQFQSSV